MNENTVTINVAGKILGRVATEIAVKLRGKDRPDFLANRVPAVKVLVAGVRSIQVTGGKLSTKRYYRHSGYPGALTSKTLGERLQKEPENVLKDAVRRMLPNNRLRARYLKNLQFIRVENGD